MRSTTSPDSGSASPPSSSAASGEHAGIFETGSGRWATFAPPGGRAGAALRGQPGEPAPAAGGGARRGLPALALRAALPLPAPPRGSPFTVRVGDVSATIDYEPAESQSRHVRGQLQLARSGVVPAQLPGRRGPGALLPLPGRRLHGGVPHRLRPDAHPAGRGRRAAPAPDRHLPPRRGRPAPLYGAVARYHDRPRVAEAAGVPRVLQRRGRGRASGPPTRPAGPAWWRP